MNDGCVEGTSVLGRRRRQLMSVLMPCSSQREGGANPLRSRPSAQVQPPTKGAAA